MAFQQQTQAQVMDTPSEKRDAESASANIKVQKPVAKAARIAGMAALMIRLTCGHSIS
jgi:hypothetical protein